MDSNQNSLVLKLGNDDGIRTFQDWTALKIWFNEESNKWGWVRTDESGKANELRSALQLSRQQINQIDSNPPNPNRPTEVLIREFITRLESLYQSGDLIYSGSKTGIFLLSMYKENEIRAMAALDYISGKSPVNYADQARVWERIKGVALAVQFKNNDSAISISKENLSNIYTQYQESFSQLIGSITEKEKALSEEINSLRKKNAETLDNWNTLLDSAKSDKEKEFKSLKTRMTDVENTYREAIQLQAPVDYWLTQESHHNNEARFYLVIFFLVGLGYLLSVASLAYFIESKAGSLGYERYGLLAIAATLGGAIVRLFYKLYINHIHGASHAKEKVVQIKTFLALGTEGNKLGSEEMHLLLSTILRPRTTALLKDEFPIVSPIELIQKGIKPG